MKLLKGGKYEPLTLGVTPVGFLVKRALNVSPAADEFDVDPVDKVRPAKKNEPNLGSSCRTVALGRGRSADNGSFVIDEMIGHATSAGQAGPFGFSSRNVNFEIPPREELVT